MTFCVSIIICFFFFLHIRYYSFSKPLQYQSITIWLASRCFPVACKIFYAGFGSTIGDLWDICGLSVAVLGHFQVACGLGDHFATTVAHLSPKCALSVAFMFSLFNFLFFEGIPTPLRRDKNSAGRNSARTAISAERIHCLFIFCQFGA